LVGDDFLDIVAAWNLNSLTRGNIGFNNWLGAVVAGKKPRQGPNFFEFAVRGEMPAHPSPKPIEYMLKLIARLTDEGDTVLDPFMGSGTTGVACAKLGRNFIGYEINPDYFAIAEKRIAEAQLQMRLDLA
jgi:tRNA/tmRNA/rRNA uracil-C5-methylase (TrmA/RlmC/RlmD family)